MPGNAPAGPLRPAGGVPGSEVSLGKVFELRLFQLGFRQKLFEAGVFLLHLSEPLVLFCLHAAIELAPAVVGGLSDLQDAVDIGNGLALGDQLNSRFELADDLLGRVAGSFHGGVPGRVWPDEDSHSPWTDSKGPRQEPAAPTKKRKPKRTAGGLDDL
jgi:hypothetical protein